MNELWCDSDNTPVPRAAQVTEKKNRGRRRSGLIFLCKMKGMSGEGEMNGFQRKCQPRRCQSVKRKTFPVWHFQLEGGCWPGVINW